MAREGDEPGEGLRRTWLASERTYLAWLRTGFAAFAVSLGVGKVVPALTGGAQWPYAVLGVARVRTAGAGRRDVVGRRATRPRATVIAERAGVGGRPRSRISVRRGGTQARCAGGRGGAGRCT